MFLDVDKVAEGIMDKVLNGFIAKSVDPASVPVLRMFDSVLDELGL